eukprot:TRINITY_DN10457_c0_g1_i1.p1 TRINITY_DN10457_c0_g1~~TRINITY_DN10457_c0_g1_i1.p1  ORF type:complete len:150 (-),score=10.83 TRINITY_DN10457_c0_g1_i1:13-462(-)
METGSSLKRPSTNNEPSLDPKASSSKRSKRDQKTEVVRLQRKNGKIIQDCEVYIGRQIARGGWNLPKSKWANPFTTKACGSADTAVSKYRTYVLDQKELMSSLNELKGKTLGCWCKPGPCHGDVLAELADSSHEGSGEHFKNAKHSYTR